MFHKTQNVFSTKPIFFIAGLIVLWTASVLPLFAEDNQLVGVLTLEESLKLAQERNPSLVAARNAVRATEGGLVEARSGLYPHISTNAGALHLESPPSLSFGPADMRLGRENMYFVNFGATQSLYAGGRISGGIDIAHMSREIAGERLRSLSDEVVLEVKKAFYSILFARELIRVRRDALKLLEEHLTTARKKYKEGTVAEYDVLRAEVEAANARPPLIEAENQLSLAESNFKRAVGLDIKSQVSLVGELRERLVSISGSDVQKKAMDCRAEVGTAKMLTRVAESQKQIAQGDYKPAVSLFANYFGTSPEFFISQSSDFRWNWMAGINFSLPIFSGFETRGRVQRREAEIDETRARLYDVSEQVRLEVERAVLNLAEAQALVQAQGENVRQAEKALRIARVRYEQGIGTQLEVTDSRLALTQAQVNQASAFYRNEVALAELERAVGCQPLTETTDNQQ